MSAPHPTAETSADLARPEVSADDFWPALVEFALGLRGWWMGLCAALDLTPTQGNALRILDPDRPVAMSTLAEALLCDASNVTGVVDKLESRGLIARQPTEHDRRIKMLVVTEAGRELRQRLVARSLEPPPSIAALPEEARRQLAEVLRTAVRARGSEPALLTR